MWIYPVPLEGHDRLGLFYAPAVLFTHEREPGSPVLTAKRAAQHVRLSRANDAYEHLCILTLLPSLAPLHLMLADTPWPHGFDATLANVGPLSEGFERSVASPLQPRRLCAMGRTV
jgi:hypothetical protein